MIDLPYRWHPPISVGTRWGLVGLLLVALGGCGSLPWLGREKDPNPPSPLPSFTPEAEFAIQWRQDVGRGSDGRRLRLVPALSDGRLYTADARGQVTAIQAADGRLLWRRDLKRPFSGGPDAHGDRLVIGSTKGELLALTTDDGSELWRAQVTSEILSIPRLTDDMVVVHTLDDHVLGFDAASGDERWRFTSQAPVLILRGSSSPVIVPSGAIVGLSGGRLIKLDLEEGAPLWTVRVTMPTGRSELERITDIDADPIVVGETLYVGTFNGDLAAVDVASGAVLWRRTLSIYSGLIADRDAIYVTDAQDHVWAAEPDSGAGQWRQDQLAHRQLSPPALLGDWIIVGDFEGYLHALAREDGRLVARLRVGRGPIRARPLAVDGRLYVFGDDGTLAALTLGTAGRPERPAGTATQDSTTRSTSDDGNTAR
ncbi:outer membrane protein assembly factor BamB [Thioalkalicoccus limnaeus]|uniref:Outer membrane protein assembly factor BamB n=1 Tax=Thioalkalicoccus limnaeus TaxID=120681 RepID=A0ABV4BD57_9GAMM